MINLYHHYIEKLQKIGKNALNSEHYETAMAAIAAMVNLNYEWNQFYADDMLEMSVATLANKLLPSTTDFASCDDTTILFYDGFGLDTRGLALNYLNALVALKYTIVYVTITDTQNSQPEIAKVLKKGNAIIRQLTTGDSYSKQVESLYTIIKEYRPGKVLCYTQPDDVAAAVVLSGLSGKVARYWVNLTDHAFWLGKAALDTCIEFREYGAAISYHHRKIAPERIKVLPLYPFINRAIPFAGLPEETKNKKIVFSGGSLYKTIGDHDKFYYMVHRILEENPDTVFLYAGSGDTERLYRLQQQWQGRVIHISERSDFFPLMEHIDLYLSTYPITGGLMTQYAVMAGKIPLILTTPEWTDASGSLIHQEELGVEFYDPDSLINEATHILQDDQYRLEKTKKLSGSVPTEADFAKILQQILTGTAPAVPTLPVPSDAALLAGYRQRFSKNKIATVIARKRNRSLIPHFPGLFLSNLINRIRK